MPLEIYLHIPQEGFELCHPVDDGGVEFAAGTVDGTPRASSWRPLEVRLVRSLGEWNTRVLKPSDAPELAPYTLVLRHDAAELLRDVLGETELLELRCRDAELVMLNPPAVPGALDLKRSSIDYFEGKVSIMNGTRSTQPRSKGTMSSSTTSIARAASISRIVSWRPGAPAGSLDLPSDVYGPTGHCSAISCSRWTHDALYVALVARS